jgi:hypothetical protein
MQNTNPVLVPECTIRKAKDASFKVITAMKKDSSRGFLGYDAM